MNEFFVALNRLRVERNWTYDELADRIGMSRRNLLRLCVDPNARVRDRTAAQLRRFIAETDTRRTAALAREESAP